MDDSAKTALVRFYRTDTRQLTFGECWRLSPNAFVGMLFLVIRALRIKLPVAEATPWMHSVPKRNVDSFEPEQRQRVAQRVDALRELGFEANFYYAGASLGPTKQAAVALLDGDRRIHAAIFDIDNGSADPKMRVLRTDVSLFSKVDGKLLVTTSGPYEMDGPPEILGVHAVGASEPELLALHTQRLEATVGDAYRTAPSVEPFDPETLESFVVETNQRAVTYNSERGVLVPMSDQEVDEVRQRLAQQQPGVTINATAGVWVLLFLSLLLLWALL